MKSNQVCEILITGLPDHMREMFQRIGDGIFDVDLKRKFFSMGDTDLGTFTEVRHHIDMGNAKPIKQRMRRTSLGYANEEREHP